MSRKRTHIRVFEKQGLRQEAPIPLKLGGDFEDHYGVDAVFLEGLACIDSVRGELQRDGELALKVGDDVVLGDFACRGRVRYFRRIRGIDQCPAQLLAISIEHQTMRLGSSAGGVENLHGYCGWNGFGASGLMHHLSGFGAYSHAALGPERPSERDDATFTGFRKCVEECVGGGVVALAEVAEGSGGGGVEDEEIQRLGGGGAIEIQDAGDLGRENLADLLLRLFQDEGIANDAGAMDDAIEQAEAFADCVQRGLNTLKRGDVAWQVQRLGTCVFQFLENAAEVFVRLASAAQDDLCPGVRGDMAGGQESKASGAASDPVDCAVAEGRLRGFDGQRSVKESPDLANPGGAPAHLRHTWRRGIDFLLNSSEVKIGGAVNDLRLHGWIFTRRRPEHSGESRNEAGVVRRALQHNIAMRLRTRLPQGVLDVAEEIYDGGFGFVRKPKKV